MDPGLRRAMADARGVARTTTLQRHGHSAHAIDRALASGGLRRVRRGWVATAEADPHLVSAARAGVVITCVSQARREGWWTLHDGPPHVAAPAHAGRSVTTGAVTHWSAPLVARHPDALVDRVENALVLIARCQPHDLALAVWESAFRLGAADRDVLLRLPLPPAARRLAEEATVYSDSGLETLFRTRLHSLGLPIRAQIWILGHRVDFLIGERLVVQIDGGHHVGAQRTQDIAHDAELTLRGYHVIRVGYAQVVERWHEVQDLIMVAVAQGLHRA